MSKVINIRNAPKGWQDNPEYVYIGRYNSRYGLKRSIWYNPYKMLECPSKRTDKTGKVIERLWNDKQRWRVIHSFSAYLKYNEMLQSRLHELEGKTLVCWCAPKPCHGGILLAELKLLNIGY